MACILLAGCATSGLSLVKDERVTIVAPKDRVKVRLPVTVEWTVTKYGGPFGVFVDLAPQPPGKPLSWIAHDDRSCRAVSGCPDTAYLADRGVFTTRNTRFVVSQVRNFSAGERQRRREFHEVTIVLLDAGGRRLGESAFSVEFQVVRPEVS
jgi:hypothetical protein